MTVYEQSYRRYRAMKLSAERKAMLLRWAKDQRVWAFVAGLVIGGFAVGNVVL